ncbi:hypothetical protein TNCV_1169841 [Trichonephila clavipes]|uniref:Uncharacterized protein n=1 Tax=Trichonephila clavipes TaxID=2585209 RepID=A0A8X6T2L0_TRICX|nr:hypothetical protein TNCV_1169841 [Trichonephila clavipes]
MTVLGIFSRGQLTKTIPKSSVPPQNTALMLEHCTTTNVACISFSIQRHYRVGSEGVKVTNSWLAGYEVEPSTTLDPPCRGDRWTLNRRSVSFCCCGDVVRRRGNHLKCCPRHLIDV